MAAYPHGAGQRKEFYIVTELGKKDKVLDIRGENTSAGAHVIIYKKGGTRKANQLWYLNPQGQIRSALNDMTMHNNQKGQGLLTEMGSNDPRSQWRIEGNKIVNGANECLDVRGAKDDDNTEVCAYDYKNKTNQHWLIMYA